MTPLPAPGETPAHLRSTVRLLGDYLTRDPGAPLFVAGEFGVGRGTAIERTAGVYGMVPLWCYESGPVSALDLDGNPVLPVYDVEKPNPEVLSSLSVVLVPSDFVPSGDTKGVEVLHFPPPPLYALEDLLAGAGYPRGLAKGNPTYAAVRHAARAWDVAQVAIASEELRPTGWDAFRAGGKPPVDDVLFAYYAAENLPVEYTWPNTLMFLRRHISAWLFDRGLDEVRARWPERTRFPSLLRVPKERRGRSASSARPEAVVAPSTRDIPAVPKTYSMDWS